MSKIITQTGDEGREQLPTSVRCNLEGNTLHDCLYDYIKNTKVRRIRVYTQDVCWKMLMVVDGRSQCVRVTGL